MNLKVLYLAVAFFLECQATANSIQSYWIRYSSAYDGSAAVSIDDTFFACGSDEDNLIRIFRHSGGMPVEMMDLSNFLEVEPRFPETDLEGAARIGDRIYWITSHGRNRRGKDSPSRRRFFATDILPIGQTPRLAPVNRPYKDLLQDLMADERLRTFDLAPASARAPKSLGAFNIEALTATTDKHLLIGFRSPVPNGRALIVPFLNPDEVVEGRRAKFGRPIQLDLEGLGIRSLASANEGFIILAGPSAAAGSFKMFAWAGENFAPIALPLKIPGGFAPETVLMPSADGAGGFLLLGDDSAVLKVGRGNSAARMNQIGFRGLRMLP